MIRDRIAAAKLSFVLMIGLSGCEQAVLAASSQSTPEGRLAALSLATTG
jgi:hypothetical protein